MESERVKKMKKYEEQEQQVWTKKVVITTNAIREEQETISMYIRSADTMINLLIKSPAKWKKTSRQHMKPPECAASTWTIKRWNTTMFGFFRDTSEVAAVEQLKAKSA